VVYPLGLDFVLKLPNFIIIIIINIQHVRNSIKFLLFLQYIVNHIEICNY